MSDRENLKEFVIKKVFLRLDPKDFSKGWIFDFRRVTLTPDFLQIYVNLFFENYQNEIDNKEKFQVCGLESASIALISAIVLESQKRGLDINGFFIRKSKKKHDLHNDIEGIPNEYPVIIVDDILNSGGSVRKQLVILQREKIKMMSVFPILRFRDLDQYNFLLKENILVKSIFELNDFNKELGLKNKEVELGLIPTEFKTIWSRKYAKGVYKHVMRKSSLVLDGEKIYFGTEEGIFFCVDAVKGDILWQKKILFGADDKYILSTPIILDDKVFFGAYDGNFYCLDKNTGKQKWVYMDADWIGSSPTVSEKNNLVYIGLEYGYFKKKGGVVALDIKTGKEVWKEMHDSLTHCSPYVSDKWDLLFCGSNDGILRIYNSKTGKKLIELIIGAEIKAGFAENSMQTKVAFGSFNKKITVIDLENLEIDSEFETLEAVYSNPTWLGEDLIITCLDKRVYKYDTFNKMKKWEFLTNSRIFSDPVIIKDKAYIGNNSGALYILNLETGKQVGYLQFAERIVNRIIYSAKDNCIYIPTLGHEIYCITGDFLK